MKMTLAASLAAGSAPLKVNAATEVVSQQSVQNANENTGDISKNAESAEIILEEDESGTVLTTLEEVEEQLNQAFGSELQSAGISVKDWNIYSEVSAIRKRWVPLAGEGYAGTDYPGILAKMDGTCKIGVNRTFGKLDYFKTDPKIEKEFTITIKREPAYETRSLVLELTGNGTVTVNSDALTAGSNDIAKNDVTLTIKPAANQYVKAVFLNNETDITEQLQFHQCTGTYTLAGGEEPVALRVEFAEAGLKAKEVIEPIDLLKTAEEDIGYAAVAQDIINKVIYTETIYLLGGNYVALPIVRTYIIGKEPTVVKFDQNSILKTYDGNPAGLTAGVFDSKGNRISEAELTYTGVDLGGVEYQSTEAPINAGVYQVTASYGGDDVHQAAIPNIIGLVTIAQARPATIKINDITTDEGVTPDPQAYSYEREGFVGENDNTRTDLLTEIKCKEGADITKAHEIVGVVNRDVAKNYMRVKVESGTHHVIPKTRVHVTLISNAASGTFPDGADVLNYDFTEDEPMLQLPEVTAKDGWKFTGWTVAGQEQKTIDPDTESINVMEYASFDNDSKNGTLTIFAAYEKEEEKTVNVYFSINKEKGEFTENPEAENLSYENLTEDQLLVPKVAAKDGYVFTGWRGQGAEEIEWDAEAETFGVTGLAHFAEGSNVGYATIEAQFEEEPEEEKQMSADIIIDLDKGYFEGWEGAEEL